MFLYKGKNGHPSSACQEEELLQDPCPHPSSATWTAQNRPSPQVREPGSGVPEPIVIFSEILGVSCEAGHGGNIYVTEISKRYKVGLVPPVL